MKLATLFQIVILIGQIVPSTLFAENLSSSSGNLYYPRPEVINDSRGLFPLRVLQLVLAKVHAGYVLTPSDRTMDQDRALLQLEMPNGGIDVVWTMTSADRELRLAPVRIPIDKGLIGWRLVLISNKTPEKFKSVFTRDELRKLIACQGHDWPDTAILRGNGIQVVTNPNYQNLFRLVTEGIADYFPRSSLEIWNELDKHSSEGIMLDPYITIHYSAAMYFFVNKTNTKLLNDISNGFEKAIADGSFERLFQSEYGEKLRKAKFSSRHIINLENPLLPKLTPTDRKELWFSP